MSSAMVAVEPRHRYSSTLGSGAGTLQCIPNAKNPRDLDISISYDFAGQNGEAHNVQKYRMR